MMTLQKPVGQTQVLRGQQVVEWVDTDASGRIHFTAVFRWVEAVEHHAYRQAGLGELVHSLPRINVGAEYKQPLTAGDQLDIDLRAHRIGNSSINYSWQIFCEGKLAVEGHHTVVHVGDEGQSASIPRPLRDLLTEPQ